MQSETPLSRRGVVTSGAAAVGLVGATALAGCSGSSSSVTAAPGTPTEGSAGGAASGAAASGGAASGGATSGGAAGGAVAPVASVPVGGAIAAKTPGGASIILARPTAQKVVAFSTACTHKGCPVELFGTLANCHCHGSVFNALTGAATKGPAVNPLASIPVTVSGDMIVLA